MAIRLPSADPDVTRGPSHHLVATHVVGTQVVGHIWSAIIWSTRMDGLDAVGRPVHVAPELESRVAEVAPTVGRVLTAVGRSSVH